MSLYLFPFLLQSWAAIPLANQEQESRKIQQPFAPFQFLNGHWACRGKFVRSGKEIASDLVFENALDNSWVLLHQDDKPPFNYHALYEWGWDKKEERYLSPVQDSLGGFRIFFSKGWEDQFLTWETEKITPPQRFSYKKLSQGEIEITYSVKGEANWDPIDSLDCKHDERRVR